MGMLYKTATTNATTRRKNIRMGALAASVAVGMLGLAYASVPLYEIFCRVTGFGGTTQVSETAAPGSAIGAVARSVRFNVHVMPELEWQVTPAEPVSVVPGEAVRINYIARNTGDEVLVGTSSFNVTPNKIGPHFMKIECFCFTEQTLEPGEEIEMPVVFFLNPSIDDDINTAEVPEVTLSYTFFRVEDESAIGKTASVATIDNNSH